MIAYRDRHSFIFICLLLILATAVVYWQVQGFDFVNYDDGDYVKDNVHVQSGFTFQSLIWAMTTGKVSSNWHPLTLLSHMLDCQMFGLWAGGHHLTNLFFHIANSLLLFLVFRRMTGSTWKSGFVAALFALHPLHVQSVAWVSERKDVLSAFFWMLTIWAYVRYVRRPGWAAYVWVVVFFILGLMSKPMVVTLPFVLLLLDYWPLNRIQLAGPNNLNLKITGLLGEKIPLFLLAAASAGITIYVQQQGGAVKSLDVLSLSDRLTNVLISYMNYILKTIYPAKLAAFYPFPAMFSWWEITAALITLASLTGLAIRLMIRSPYIIVGWLWFIGTLVPVIGLVQIGVQCMADRYMYLPMIGLLIIISWGIPELISNWRYKRFYLGIPAIFTVIVLSVVTWKQTGYWKDSISLFSHAISVTKNNPVAHWNMGTALSKNGKTEQAITHYQKALAINPMQPQVYISLGLALNERGDKNQALSCFEKAALLDPKNDQAQYNLGTFLFQNKRLDQAVQHLEKAVALKPDSDQAQFNLANTLFQKRQLNDALIHAEKAISINSSHEKAHQLSGIILFEQEQFNQALAQFNVALNINPNLTTAHHYKGLIFLQKKQIGKALVSLKNALISDPNNEEARQIVRHLEAKLTTSEQTLLRELEKDPDNGELCIQLGKIYQAQGFNDKAIEQYKLVIRQHPESIDALYDLVALHADQGEYTTAIAYIKQAISCQPDNPAHEYNMACLFARQNQTSSALEWLKKALDKGYENWNQIRADEDLKSIRDTQGFKRLIENR
ncbi:MAG: tetratricopeptide repeat protein [Desulfosalsimonadaceae bacterium]